eukprot:gene18552-24273_t
MSSSMYLTPWGQKLMKQLNKSRNKYKPKIITNKWNIVTGDKVEVIQGPQTGQRGTVLAVLRQKYRIIIDGVNLRRRIVKPTAEEDGKKVRVSKLSGAIMVKPKPLPNRVPWTTLIGPKDTLVNDVFEVTFKDYEKYLPYIYKSYKNENN